MIRHIKVFGLSLLALCALGGVAAGAASAKFDSHAATTTLTGDQVTVNEFTVNTGSVTCKKAHFTGTSTGTEVEAGVWTSPDLTITPSYTECTNSLLGAMTVNMNGCQYTFTAGETTEAGTRVDGEVHIICETGKEIEVKRTSGTQLCVIKVPPQTVGGITYHNLGTNTSTKEVEVEANVTGLHYSQSGALCLGGTGSFTNGTYTGTVLEKGESGGSQTGIWVT